MNLERVKNHKPIISDSRECKEFAVLIPIVDILGKPSVLFQVRSEKLFKQPNEICFPGGRLEIDEIPVQGAIRETCEELLISQDNLEILGELDTLVTPFNTVIYPFTANLNNYKGSFSENEVQEIFYVPLDFLLTNEPQCSYLEINMKPREDFPFEKVQYGRNYPWAKGVYPVYFYEYENKVIWGITARILRNFTEIIR